MTKHKWSGLQAVVYEHRTRMKFSNMDLLGKLEEEFEEVKDAKNMKELQEELADLVIVAFGLASYRNINLQQAILDKMKVNEAR